MEERHDDKGSQRKIRCVAGYAEILRKAGLVPEVTRTAGGIRDYQPDDLGWLELALCMRSAGLPVSGIVEYRKLFQQGESTIPQRLKLLTDQREELLSMKIR